ncbi:MAG: formate dehydrogenase accessory sulfurtransferase FdhD [Rhizobiales bacterium]|nr:formate dehydrogenase accessory sulfurtransferase FdhD [Hyphomicrobiales bacterium]
MAPVFRVGSTAWRGGTVAGGSRAVPEETPIAMVYDGGAHAVMMATPQDLEDFAVGFSLSEGIVAEAAVIRGIDVVEAAEGIELRMWLAAGNGAALAERRRRIAGPTGCGLCGVDSLAEAVRPVAGVGEGIRLSPAEIMAAMEALPPLQVLNRETHAVHAAAFWQRGQGIVLLREDVGRHNALDKLVGALARGGIDGASGVLLLTSRVSVEMIQKAATAGIATLVAVSAPTSLAIRTAEAAGITLVAIARRDGFEVFTRPDRIVMEAAADVA